jgi:hypothetical protein
MWEVITACVIMHNMIFERRSVMIASMIRDETFRVNWLIQTLDRHPFKIFFMHVMRFKIGQPTMPSMKIR